MIPTKQCSLCHWYLPLECFHKYRDGLRSECKACRKLVTLADYLKRKPKINQTARAYYAQHREQISQYAKSWREQNQETLKPKKAAYARANSAKYVQRNRLRRAANPERANEYSRKWRRNNPETRRASSARNKAKRRQVVGTCTPAQWKAKCEYFGWRCYLCGVSLTSKTAHMEHRIPLSRGGTHWPANLAPACVKCNLSKNNKTEAEYRALDRFEYVTQLVACCS